jgi:hypothetical protein
VILQLAASALQEIDEEKTKEARRKTKHRETSRGGRGAGTQEKEESEKDEAPPPLPPRKRKKDPTNEKGCQNIESVSRTLSSFSSMHVGQFWIVGLYSIARTQSFRLGVFVLSVVTHTHTHIIRTVSLLRSVFGSLRPFGRSSRALLWLSIPSLHTYTHTVST